MSKQKLTVVLPKGRLLAVLRPLFAEAGLHGAEELEEDRRLLLDGPDGFRYLLARPADVVTYVRQGAADMGLTGKDCLLESPGGFFEVLDTGLGYCRMVVAGPNGARDRWNRALEGSATIRVASKFPGISRSYLSQKQVEAEIIQLGGAVELAPLVGLAEVIIDLVQTGGTLKANGLQIFEEIMPITTRLIVNQSSYRTKEASLTPLIERIRRAVNREVPSV